MYVERDKLINIGLNLRSGSYNQVEKSANLSFKGETEPVEKQKRKDIYAQMPIRALGYSNELGEAIRPLSPMLANLSWLPAIAYISADIADKYKQDEYAVQEPSKKRATNQFVTQLLASVLMPTLAVKAGQSIVNSAAAISKTGLTLNQKEKVSDIVINSMKSGEHKNYLNPDGLVNKDEYKAALSDKFDEIIKHKKSHEKNRNPIKAIIGFFTKSAVVKPEKDNIKFYAGTVVDRLIDERQQLLDNIKPKTMSQKSFEKFERLSSKVNLEEKQSMVFDRVRKLEKGRMFNNRILKSIGGLAALAVMARPIDKFVEHVIINKFVSPQIDNITAMYEKQRAAKRQHGDRSLKSIRE